MNKLIGFTILLVFGIRIRAELVRERNFAQKSTRYEILNNQKELTDDYNALLLEFATNHFEGYQTSVLLASDSCSICGEVLGVLMNASMHSFLTVNDFAATGYAVSENQTGLVSYPGYWEFVVFLTKNVNEFLEHFAKLRLMYAWNPRPRHLIFIVEKPDDQELEMIFRECWSHKVLNAAVIIWNQVEAYTYNPYLKNHSDMSEKVQNWSRLFYDKLRNMNGHSIRTKYVPFSSTDPAVWIKDEARYKFLGADFGVAEAFFQSVNATPALINLTVDMVPCYESFKYRYRIWKDLRFNDAELWINFMTFQSKFHDRSERAYPLRRDDIRILAPKSGLRTPSVLDPYNNITWICVLLSLITFAIYSRVLYIRQKIDDDAFLRTLGIFLGKNLAKRRHGLLEKITFIVFTMSSLLILSAYQGALYSALATVSHYPEINTMPELYRQTKTIHSFRMIAELLPPYVQRGINVVAFDTDAYVEFMKTHRDQAYAFANTNAQHIVKLKTLSENGTPFFHVMNDYSFPAFASHTLPYGSPYLNKLERVVLACKEAGLDQYWEAETNLYAILSGTIISTVAEERPLKKLSLETQLIGFYIWGTGLLVGAFFFIAEICIHAYRK